MSVTAPRQRALLAVLLVHANEVVSTDRLLDLVWGEGQPDVGALRYQVSKLRDALGAVRGLGQEGVVVTMSPGYVLRASPENLDSLRFVTLIGRARDAAHGDPSQALGLLNEALALWRGPAYSDFAYEEFAHLEAERLEELRRGAIEDRIDIELTMGGHRELVADLERLTGQHPHRERIWGQLAVALYRSGRQADAVAAFQQLRDNLGNVGLDLSPPLRELEDRVFAQDGSLLIATETPDRLRGYVLRGRIGEGTHGVVWRAAQPGIGREVALKAVRPDLANRPEFVRGFEAEAQLVAALEHPNIVSLYDFWRDPEGAYLVMPYLRGGNLAAVLKQGPLDAPAVFSLVTAIGAALGHAHRRGVVHRDVTPHNVLLDEEGNPYLSDFGMAALLGGEGPPATSSPAYMSPEASTGQKAVVQSDVFSLGVLVHASLTGRVPAVGETLPLASEIRHDLSRAVDDVISCATSPDPIHRYGEVQDFVDALAHSLGVSREDTPSLEIEARNPYKGLRAFEESDAADFFGREMLVSELVQSVARHRLVGVVGPSGCGKSSLVKAGMIPVLRRGALPGSERWLVTDMYPGSQPLAELEAALMRMAVERPDGFEATLADPAANLTPAFDQLLPHDGQLLVVVDQFEELFTLTVYENLRDQFLDLLTRIAGDPSLRARIVLTMRADFYDRPLEYPEFGELVRRGLVSVTMPAREHLHDAIAGPAARVGVGIDEGLAETIVNDVAGQPGALPLMEYALTELFERRTDQRLSLDAYNQTAGVMGALGRRAEDIYSRYDQRGRDAVRQVFLRLVTVEAGSEDTRRRIPLSELQGLGVEPVELQQVLDEFGAHRLLTFDRNPDTREPTVEVAHEALLSRWERLRTWIDDRRDDLGLQRKLAAAATEWTEANQAPEYLMGGGRLDHYQAFATETDLPLTQTETDFLAKSRKHGNQLASRRRRRRRGIMAGFGVAALIATVFAIVAFASQRRAEDEATSARASSLIAFAAEAIDEDPELSILLLLEAIDTVGESLGTISALHEAVLADRLLMRFPREFETGVLSPKGDLLIAFGDENVAALSVPSGDVIWEEEQNPNAFLRHGAFSLDGRAFLTVPVATGEGADTVPENLAGIHVIDTATFQRTIHEIDWPYPLDSIVGNSSRVVDPALPLAIRAWGAEAEIPSLNEVVALRVNLADGSAEAVGAFEYGQLDGGQWSTDRDVRHLALSLSLKTTVVDLETKEIETYGPEVEYSSTALLSPDGSHVVSSSRVRNDVWNTNTDTKEWGFFRAETSLAVFTPDGSKLAVGNQLFDATSGEMLLAVPDQGWDTSMSADGSHLFTSTGVWDLGPRGEVGAINLPIGGFYALFTDTAGRYGAALDFNEDRAYAFDTESGEVFHSVVGATGDAAVSPDGSLLAYQEVVGTNYGHIVVVDLESQQEKARLTEFCLAADDSASGPDCRPYPETPFSGWADDLEFTSDGRHLVGMFQIGAWEGRAVAAWDLEQGQLVYWTELGDYAPVEFSPDGKLLAVANWDAETVDIVDIATWTPIGRIPRFGFVRFASNESVVLILDGLTVYNWADGAELRSGAQGCVQKDYAVSPDGAILAMSCDGEARVVIHDLESLEMIHEIRTGAEPIRGISFVDDTHLLVLPHPGPGLILTTDADELIHIARERLTRDFTEEECVDYGIKRCIPAPDEDLDD